MFDRSNEYRQPLYRLLAWIWFKLTGYNEIGMNLISVGWIGAIYVTFVQIGKKFAKNLSPWVFPSFILFILSPILFQTYEGECNMSWHMATFFFLWAAYFLLEEEQSLKRVAIGTLMAALSPLSLSSSGVTLIVGLLVVHGIFRFHRLSILRKKRALFMKEAACLALPTVSIGLLAIILTVGFQRPWWEPPWVYPSNLKFWDFFFNQVSHGFGFQALSWELGVFCFFVVAVPLLYLFWKRGTSLPSNVYLAGALFTASIAVMLTISLGRTDNVAGLITSKASRFWEFHMLLIPAAVLGWSELLQRGRGRHTQNQFSLAWLWLFIFIGMSGNWDYVTPFQQVYHEKIAGLACVRAFYEGKNNGYCPQLIDFNLANNFRHAKEMGMSIYRDNMPQSN